MKHTIILFLLAICAYAQGPLTPPGVPAPTMKTLAQIEPRIDVLALGAQPPYIIAEPGSYYLSGNIIAANGQSGITILAQNVTLDLNGFTISSPFGGSTATAISSEQPAVIRNGFIKSNGIASNGTYSVNGFLNGILMPTRGSVKDLFIQGCAQGIISEGSVTSCQVWSAQTGIRAHTVVQCISQDCSVEGINFSTRCSDSFGSGYLHGIYSPNGEIEQCEGIAVSKYGISGYNISKSKGVGGEAGIIAGGNVSDSVGICTQIDHSDRLLYGIKASGNVSNSKGSCTGNVGTRTNWFGIQCDNAVNSSATSNGEGIRAFANASNCYGKGGLYCNGIWVEGTATSCRGDHNIPSGTALRAAIAVSCTSANGIIDSPSKHLGTP